VSHPRQPAPFADALSAMPELWARLIAEHVPDPTGRRCRACTTAGTGSPGTAWPCRIRDAADAARTRWASARTATIDTAGRAPMTSPRPGDVPINWPP
jgi:hypothetical protein